MSKVLLEHFRGELGWSFAIVNGRLGEIFFDMGKGVTSIMAHAYVKREKYKTKREQKMIEIDTEKNRFTYKKGEYSLIKSP